MRTFLSAALALAASSLPAFGGGTITSGDSSLQFVGNPIFSAPFGDVTELCDSGGPDTMYKLTWYYRTPNASGGNRIFSSLDTPTEVYSGNLATVTYTNAGPLPAGFERFDAKLAIALIDGAAAHQATIDQRMVFTASAANTGPVTYQVFALIDPDLASTPSDDSIYPVLGPNTRIEMYDAFKPDFADSYAIGATRFEMNTGTALRQKLNSSGSNLSSDANPVYLVDAAFAYQWTLTLAPGGSRTLSVKYAYNLPACRADFNSNGFITVQDIFDFLTAWFGHTAFSDYNLSGTTTVQDIFDFLTDWFARAC